MSEKRKPVRHGGADGQAPAGRRAVKRRWGFRPAAVAPAPEAPERPAHLAPPPPTPGHAPPNPGHTMPNPGHTPGHAPPNPGHTPGHAPPLGRHSTPPPAHRPPPPPPAHRPPPPPPAHHPPPAPPLAARRHPSNVDAVPQAVPSPLPQRATRPPAGRPSTAAGEGSIDDMTALMDFLRRDDPSGA